MKHPTNMMMMYMEIRMLVVAVAIVILGALPIASSASIVERSDHKCGQYPDQSWAYCDLGRCCSTKLYCGDNWEHCSEGFCWYQCHVVTSPPLPSLHLQSNYQVVDQTAGGEVLITRLVLNATHNNHFLNNGDDNDLLELEVPPTNASSSFSSPAASPLSCATSLSRLSVASRHKYPFVALPAPRPQNNATTHCGRCLMVTSFGVGGLPNQVKVRVAHEHNNKGLELDFNTFRQLDTNGSGITKDQILVKYQFDSC